MFDGSTFPKWFKWLNKHAYYEAGLTHDKDIFVGVGRLVSFLKYAIYVLIITCDMMYDVFVALLKKDFGYAVEIALWVIITLATYPFVITGLAVYDLSPARLRLFFKSLT